MRALKTQARPYANALFELANEADNHAVWYNALKVLSTVVRDPLVVDMLKVRTITPPEWVEWICALQPAVLDTPEIRRFLHLLAEKRRLGLLPDIEGLFEAAWREATRKKAFTVFSPNKWKKAESAKIQDFLSKRFHCQADVAFKTHPEMLGGVEIVGEGWRLDYSVHGWLTQLREHLSHSSIS